MKLISGSSNPAFAKSLASALNVPMLETEISKFSNGEKRVRVLGEAKGQNIVLVQSFSQPVDEHIMETLLLIDALERLGCRHINVIIPWMGYSLQDKVFREGEPISAKVVADLISSAYAKRVYILDLHNTSIPGFFALPTHHLTAETLFAEYVEKTFSSEETIVASPDFGGLKRARHFAKNLGVDLVNVDKSRDLKTGKVSAVDLHGEVQGKIVLLFDDVIVSGGTVVEVAKLMKEKGAKQVHFFATHGLFANNAIDKLEASEVDSIVITNSIAQSKESTKIVSLDVATVFAEELRNWI